MYTTLAVLVFAATPPPDIDPAALVYFESVVYPTLITICKEVQPESAASYDALFARWSAKHQREIAGGESTFRDQIKRDGLDFDRWLRETIETESARIRAMPEGERKGRCTHFMGVLRSES